MKTVLLINVGTPDSTSPEDVGIYLREFLMDENIIQIPRPFRDILVKGLIVPKRKFSSAEKYKKIWTSEGSPLLIQTRALQAELQKHLDANEWQVEIAMQVGNPSLKKILDKTLTESSEVYFCPLYPQYATATTGGALQILRRDQTRIQKLSVLPPFYEEPWFLESQAQRIRDRWREGDELLLSFHGLPVSQLKSHRTQCGESASCCASEAACRENCYKAQCLRTAERLRDLLKLDRVSVGFQSRLGRAQWIEPSTEQVVKGLLKRNVRHLKVACPSFVADCLETLEEIGMELKALFLEGGGETFELVPCVNDDSQFAKGLADSIKKLANCEFSRDRTF